MTTHEHKTSDQLMNEAKQTRAQIDATLAALEDQLAPKQMLHHIGEAFLPAREGTTQFAQNLGGTIRDNPLPATLTAVGLGWLLLSGQRSDRAGLVDHSSAYEFGDDQQADRLDPNRPDPRSAPYSEGSGSADTEAADGGETGKRRTKMKDRISDAREQAREHAYYAANRLNEESDAVYRRASDASYRAREGARRASTAAADFVRERPLLTGLAVAGLGAIVATLVLTRTDRGRDALSRGTDAAKDRAGRARAHARDQAENVSNAAADVSARAKERFNDVSTQARDGATQVREKAGSKSADVREAVRKKRHGGQDSADNTMETAHPQTEDLQSFASDERGHSVAGETYVNPPNQTGFGVNPEPVTPPSPPANAGVDRRPAAGTGDPSIPNDPKNGTVSSEQTKSDSLKKL